MRNEAESFFPELAAALAAAEPGLAADAQLKLAEELKLLDSLVHKALQESPMTLAKFYEKRIAEMEGEVREFGGSAAQLTVDNNRLRKQVQELQEALEKRLNENDEIYILHTREVSQLNATIEALKADRTRLDAALNDKKIEAEGLGTTVKSWEADFKELAGQRDDLRAEVEELKSSLAALQGTLDDAKRYGETMEGRFQAESRKYNEVVFLLSQKESDQPYLALANELKESQNTVRQLVEIVKDWMAQADQDRREAFRKQLFSPQPGRDPEVLKRLFMTLLEEFDRQEETVPAPDDASGKAPSYLKSLGVGEVGEPEEGSESREIVEYQPNGTAFDTASADGLERTNYREPSIAYVVGRAFKPEPPTPALTPAQLLSTQEILDPTERDKYLQASIQARERRIARGIKRSDTVGNQLQLLQAQTARLLQSRNNDTQTQESGVNASVLNTSALSVLLNLMDTDELHTSFFLSEAQIQDLLSTSSNPTALTEHVLQALFGHVAYLEQSIKAYICWSDIASAIISEVHKKCGQLKGLLLSATPQETKLARLAELDETAHKALGQRLDGIFKNRAHPDPDFLRKVNMIAKTQAAQNLGDSLRVFKKSKFAERVGL